MIVAKYRRGQTLIVRGNPAPPPHARERQRGLASGLAAVVILSAAAVFPLITRGINPYDEGMIAYGAEQVLHGRQPAVDFYSPYGPGAFYLLAAAYRLLGIRLLVERWLAGGLLVIIGALAYLLLVTREADGGAYPPPGGGQTADLRSVRSRESHHCRLLSAVDRRVGISALAGVLIVLLLAAGWWYTPVNGGTLALMLLSGLVLQRGLASGHPGWAGVSGLVAGVTLLWRFVFGGALVIADAAVWAVMAGGISPSIRRRNQYAGLVALLSAAAAIAVPIYAWLIREGGQRALRSLFVWPFTSTGAADLPWPGFAAPLPQHDFTSLAFFAAATHGAAFYYGFVAAALLLWRLPLRRFPMADRQLGLWLLLLVPPLFLYAQGRTDYQHITPLLTLCMLLAALAVDSGLAVAPGGDLWRSLGALIWTASLLLLAPTILYSWQSVWLSPGRRPLDLPGPRGAGVYAPYRYSRQYRALMPLIHAYVAPAQGLYSGSQRHDVYQINDILVYFLSERDAPTYYWCLDAGVTSSQPVQEEMIEELSRNGISAAVIWTASAHREENEGGKSSGVRLLDDWLSREFVPRSLPGLFYELRLRRGMFREE